MKKTFYVLLSFIIGLPLAVSPVFAATTYTAQQVATHNTAADCWTIVNNNVYNITSYITSHPGGQGTISSICGKDGTAAFDAQHSGSSAALSALASLQIGTLATAADTASPTAPINLTASAVSTSRVNLSWTASTDNVGVTGYKITRNNSALATSTINSFSDLTTVASTTYTYSVTAFDAAGNLSPASAPVTVSTPATSPVDTLAPTASTNLTVSLNTSNHPVLAWTASTDNVGVTGYSILRNGTPLASSTSLSFTDSTSVASTTYMYSVTAFDAAGNVSPASATVSITTGATTTNPGNHNGDDNEHGNNGVGHNEHENNGNGNGNNGHNGHSDNNHNNNDHGRTRSSQVSHSTNHVND